MHALILILLLLLAVHYRCVRWFLASLTLALVALLAVTAYYSHQVDWGAAM